MAWNIRGSRCCILHIPKTAGCWVADSLRHAGLVLIPVRCGDSHVRHATWWHLRDRRLKLSQERTVVFVRHPVAWWQSVWQWIDTDKGDPARINKEVWHPFHVAKLQRGLSFPEFVETTFERQPAFFSRMCEWYTGPPGCRKISHIGKQESIAKDLIRLLQAVGAGLTKEQEKAVLKFRLNMVNASAGGVDCPKWVNRLICEQERAVLDRWKYE